MTDAAEFTNSTVPAARLTRLARGANVSQWFRYPPAEVEAHLQTFIRDEDITLIKELGLTSIRLTVAGDQIFIPAGDAPDPRRLELLDVAIRRLTDAGLLVVLVVHDCSDRLENEAAFTTFLQFWTNFGRHLSQTTDAANVVIEPINEPMFAADQSIWPTNRDRLMETVRAAMPNHTLITGGAGWSSLPGLLATTPLTDKNVIYTFHFYEPFMFTHQGAPWTGEPYAQLKGVPYPSRSLEGAWQALRAYADPPAGLALARYVLQGWDEDKIARQMTKAVEWSKTHGVPIWCGEFGAFPLVAPPEDRLAWLRDTRTALERHGIGWCVWSYDECLGLDRKYQGGKVCLDWNGALALGLSAEQHASQATA